jgi:hypothetical protein
MVAAKDKDVLGFFTLDRVDVLINGIRRPLIPLFGSAELRRNCENKLAPIVGKHIPSEPDVSVEGIRLVLCQNADPFQLGVDAIGECEIDDAVNAPKRDGRFGPVLSKRIKTLTLTSGKYEGKSVVNDRARP